VGDTGKSLLCALIALFFPETNVSRIALQDLGGKFALGNLTTVKLNISEDLPNAPLSPKTVSVIKMLSDSNRLTGEAKFVQQFSFTPLFKLFFASNHPLCLKEYDEAFLNRLVYILCMNVIPKEYQDKNLLEKMKWELSALVNHALKAYKRLVANNYVWAGDFTPEIVIKNSGISFDKMQVLEWFVEAYCEFNNDAKTAVNDLQSAYETYCRENGYESIKGGRFSRELLAAYPTIKSIKISNQKRGYLGIELK